MVLKACADDGGVVVVVVVLDLTKGMEGWVGDPRR